MVTGYAEGGFGGAGFTAGSGYHRRQVAKGIVVVVLFNTSPLWPILNSVFLLFQRYYERSDSPLKWTFIRRDLHVLLAEVAGKWLAPPV